MSAFSFFRGTATTESYAGEDTLSLHDALPIYSTQKKEKEYLNWARKDGNKNHTPDSLIAEIQEEIAIKKQGSP